MAVDILALPSGVEDSTPYYVPDSPRDFNENRISKPKIYEEENNTEQDVAPGFPGPREPLSIVNVSSSPVSLICHGQSSYKAVKYNIQETLDFNDILSDQSLRRLAIPPQTDLSCTFATEEGAINLSAFSQQHLNFLIVMEDGLYRGLDRIAEWE